jgi:hypothetical protein
MLDAAIICLAYAIGVFGFWRVGKTDYDFSKTTHAAFAVLWPISFLWLLLRVVRA